MMVDRKARKRARAILDQMDAAQAKIDDLEAVLVALDRELKALLGGGSEEGDGDPQAVPGEEPADTSSEEAEADSPELPQGKAGDLLKDLYKAGKATLTEMAKAFPNDDGVPFEQHRNRIGSTIRYLRSKELVEHAGKDGKEVIYRPTEQGAEAVVAHASRAIEPGKPTQMEVAVAALPSLNKEAAAE